MLLRMGIPTFCASASRPWWRVPIANLDAAFDHKALESSNARFNKRYEVVLQVIERFPANHIVLDVEHTSLSGMTPPQKPTSVQHCPWATLRLIVRFSTVVVGGIEFSGISTTVVTPPDRAALVPVQKPSHSVRPGSFKCTWALGRR